MARIDGGSWSRTDSYDRHESVGPGTNTTTGLDRWPCDAYDTVRPLSRVTDAAAVIAEIVRSHTASNSVAMPWPTPMHIVAAPRVPGPRARSWWTSVVAIRAPEQPSGWPSAMAPPSGLTRSASTPSSLITASDWAA